MSKVKVLIEHEDGHKQELNGDTVICFTVSKTGEFLNGKAAFIGREIPAPIYPDTIGSLVASTIEKSSGNAVRAGFNLHMVAQILEAKSKEVKIGLTEQEKKDAIDKTVEEILKAVIFGK